MSKIILASGSQARQTMLKNAGVKFDIHPADIDEETIMTALQKQGASSGNIALHLAQEKARHVSAQYPQDYIIGSDQVLSLGDKIYSKVDSVEQAKNKLQELQGQEHFLTSSVCVMKGGQDIWHKTDAAALKMKPLTAQDIDKYSEIAGDSLTKCVGCYALEGVGIRLFKDIRGDFFTILGMPLLPLLNYLDQEGLLS